MRDPSIHIKESDLIIILHGVFNEVEFPLKWRSDWLANKILEKAKSYSLPSRSITVTNDKLLKKTEKIKLAGRSDTSIFAQTLLHIRRSMHHRGLRLIQPGEKDWFDLKEVCKLATEFCNEFQVNIKDGYRDYIQIGMGKMQNFSIFKFKGMHSSICNHYEALQEIQRDKTPSATEECHDLYIATISQKIGTTMGFKNNPEKYKCFIQVKDLSNKHRVSYKTYIAAQFAGFDWKSGVPDPYQLIGEKAEQRLQVYAFQHSIKLGEATKNINFKEIRKKKW